MFILPIHVVSASVYFVYELTQTDITTRFALQFLPFLFNEMNWKLFTKHLIGL